MTEGEIARLLDVCPAHRRLLYATALLSGLRANELRSLTLKDLDVTRGGLNLDAKWTKNRKNGFQPLPLRLVAKLQATAERGDSEQLYRLHYLRRDAKRRAPRNPLLFVPSSLSRDFERVANVNRVVALDAHSGVEVRAQVVRKCNRGFFLQR